VRGPVQPQDPFSELDHSEGPAEPESPIKSLYAIRVSRLWAKTGTERGYCFFTRLLCLATHCQVPFLLNQVSVKRP
jgi:hypothetical protein